MENLFIFNLKKTLNMKGLPFFILMLWIIPGSCQAPKNMRLYYVKITPIGLSDSPRDLFYISTTNTESIPKIDFTENLGFIHQVKTDEKTLIKIVSFINKTDPEKSNSEKKFIEYGCFSISVYDKNSLIVSYNLDRLDSQKYLNSLINTLTQNELDVKVIKELKENALGPINY
jgi:hypothetical protein